MKILHICSYYNTSALYKNLFNNIADNKEYFQYVYIPMPKFRDVIPKDHGTVREYSKDSENLTHLYFKNINRIENYIFTLKVNKFFKNVKENLDINTIDFVHAHSLFINGGTALKIKKKYNKKYIVAVRATDLALFRRLPHLKKKAYEIMRNSEKIICISHALKKRLIDNYIKDDFYEEIKEKIMVIPNGVDQYWLDNLNESKELKNLTLCYAGTFLERKNVDLTIDIAEKLNEDGIDTKLNLIGGGPGTERIKEKISNTKYKNKYDLTLWCNDKAFILEKYRDSDIFIMISENETFGLTYLEAMTQGLPIIYKKNDGIDGFFNNNVGASVELGQDIQYYCNVIKQIMKNYTIISENCINDVKNFSWRNVSNQYIEIYSNNR